MVVDGTLGQAMVLLKKGGLNVFEAGGGSQ